MSLKFYIITFNKNSYLSDILMIYIPYNLHYIYDSTCIL